EAAFTRASIVFLRARSEGGAAISEAIGVAQNFHVRFGGDRRAARLLVEAAEVCRGDLRLRRSLLEAAEKSARDEATRARAKDELRQLGWLGKEVSLRFPLASGGEWDLKDWRGKIVLLVFFSVDSPQSLIWLKRFGSEVGVLLKMGVGVFFVQLGGKKTGTEGLLRSMGLVQPVVYVQEGWESPEVRKLGINAVPTVWLLDEWGRLRSFDARENTVGLVREM
ncbi:MAG: thioredoxin family protein, partial [Chthoniobacterales bacterium]|nr:thioredoxin family protein [Chthoniobacterales bacterium]